MDKTKNIVALFDFDGVVIDSESQYSLFWNEMGRKYLTKVDNFGDLIKGQTLSQIYDDYFCSQQSIQNEITKQLDEFERNMSFNYIPGAIEFMTSLKENNISIAIVTSSNDKKMGNVFKVHPELKVIVDKFITADMLTHSKPNPECFLLGAELFGVSPLNCVVFEDSFHGLQAGKSAGMKVVGLATTNTKEAIKDKADIVIDDFTSFSIKNMIEII